MLYDAYYEELELYANQQQQYVNSPHTVPPPPGPGPFPGSVEFDQSGAVIPNDLTKHPAPPIQHPPPEEDEYDDEEEYDEEGSEEGSEEDDEDDDIQDSIPAAYPKQTRRTNAQRAHQKGVSNGAGKGNAAQQDFFTFGPGLTAAGEAPFHCFIFHSHLSFSLRSNRRTNPFLFRAYPPHRLLAFFGCRVLNLNPSCRLSCVSDKAQVTSLPWPTTCSRMTEPSFWR